MTLSHTSQPLFPTVTAWQAVVYDRDKAPLSLAQIVDARGRLNETLDWEPFVQSAERLRSVTDINIVFVARKHRERLQAGDPLAAFVVTTITSPDDREVWQRVEERNRGTASALERLGLPAYYAIEAFVVERDGQRMENPIVPTSSLGAESSELRR